MNEGSVNLAKLNARLASQEISGGHAFTKHASEFGFNKPAEMASHIENVMTNPSMTRSLNNSRTAYWGNNTSSIVIRDPKSIDGGTVFKPKNGYKYFYEVIK